METNKFNALMEEVTSRYQQGGIVHGDFVKVKKEALSNPKLKDRPSNFQDHLKKLVDTQLPLRVTAVKSERPETSNDLVGGANNAPTGFWVDVCVQYAPGLWKDPMTLPLEVLDLANNDPNLPEIPDENKREDTTTEKPEEVKIDSSEENVKQTQGNQRDYGSKNTKLPTGVTKDGRDQTKVKESIEDVYDNILMESAKSVKLTIKKDVETGEFAVKVWINGKYSEDATYYTDDKQDAVDTMGLMKDKYQESGYQVL